MKNVFGQNLQFATGRFLADLLVHRLPVCFCFFYGDFLEEA